MENSERARLRVCSALLANNRDALERSLEIPREVLGDDLYVAVRSAVGNAPIPGDHRLVNLTAYLPAWVQYVGQRAILLFPRLASRLLRSSGLHHQMF
jgi:hypothetical protein